MRDKALVLSPSGTGEAMGRRILVDCGASTGTAIAELREQFGPFTEIYAIEANPDNARKITALEPEAEVIQAAVYTRQGRSRFYLATTYDGSSLFADKLSGGISPERFVEVDTIDLAGWLRELGLAADDYLVCKMDIEGAEFDVLEHLLRTGGVGMVNLLLVEWHVSRFSQRLHRRIRRLLIKLRFWLAGVPLRVWR